MSDQDLHRCENKLGKHHSIAACNQHCEVTKACIRQIVHLGVDKLMTVTAITVTANSRGKYRGSHESAKDLLK
jgi:hypothetical protein